METEGETQAASILRCTGARAFAGRSGYVDSSDEEQPEHHPPNVTNSRVTEILEGGGKPAAVSHEGAPATKTASQPLEY